ncbi:MAG: tripartite tricarboxylate transporter substrate binding protein [Beijerinckiaceae bacterium]|nr:tripartite tricarboxylate transporter substrate binding protein [Beijerinckiaceae bacterium]
MDRRAFLKNGLAGAAAVTLAPAAMAQANYPDRTIRLVVPFPPGGVNDAVARPWAEFVKGNLGSVVIENQGGAGGGIGAAAVARATPDGYTILFGSGATHVVRPIAAGTQSYDPVKDFEPIAVISTGGVGIAVHPSQPFKTLQDLIDFARANPGKLSYASPGVGSAGHMAGELFKSTAKVDIVHVPYRGGGPAQNDVVGGQIPMGMINITGQVISLHETGKIRLLAITTPVRNPAAPSIPTCEGAGAPGCVALNFAALFAPAGTPRPIVERISKATQDAMKDRKFIEILSASGFDPSNDTTPEATARFLQDELKRWTPVIKQIGLKLD